MQQEGKGQVWKKGLCLQPLSQNLRSKSELWTMRIDRSLIENDKDNDPYDSFAYQVLLSSSKSHTHLVTLFSRKMVVNNSRCTYLSSSFQLSDNSWIKLLFSFHYVRDSITHYWCPYLPTSSLQIQYHTTRLRTENSILTRSTAASLGLLFVTLHPGFDF